MERRMITTEFTQEDEKIETSLRPQYLREYIGQEKGEKQFKSLYRSGKAERGSA